MMFISVVLACSLLVTSAKLHVPHPKTIQIESLVPYDAPVDINGEPASFSGAVVIDGVSQANHLDMDCNNKFCQMMKYAVSCKAIDLGVKKICARYLLGYKYGCDVFPSPPEVLNAPSICIPAVLRMLSALKDLPSVLGPYLDPTDFSTDTCGRRCFQNYQHATHDFYASCRPQLNKTYVPFATLLAPFQEYRNQACSESPSGQNCYTAVAGLTSSSTVSTFVDALKNANIQSDAVEGFNPAVATTEPAAVADSAVAASAAAPGAPPVDLFNFYCDYGYGYANNVAIMSMVCPVFSNMGCCAATGISMMQQNPITSLPAIMAGGAADPTIFPPCLVRYLQEGNCGGLPNVDMQNYCINGSIASTTVLTGTIFMPKLVVPPPLLPFPNMYNKTGVLSLQGAVTAVLASFPGFMEYPYLFDPAIPLQVQVVDYAYFDTTFAPLTPGNGIPAQPYGSDYTNASYGNFTYQLVLQDLDAVSAQTVYGALNSPQFVGGLNKIYTGNPANTDVKANTGMFPAQFGPAPTELNAAFSIRSHWMVTLLLTVGVSAALLVGSGSDGSTRK